MRPEYYNVSAANSTFQFFADFLLYNRFNNSIDELTEQQKKMTLYACLAAFGAFIAFTAAVFLPGVGMLIALGIGGKSKSNCTGKDIF